jgi:hypothetical protein
MAAPPFTRQFAACPVLWLTVFYLTRLNLSHSVADNSVDLNRTGPFTVAASF